MSTSAISPTVPATNGAESNTRDNKVFFVVLTAIAISAMVVRAYVGSRSFLDFDEWQHVFMAGAPRMIDLRFELRTNAHPPLFFWLLRGLLHFGHSSLLYRTISVLAGAGAVFLVGVICRKACRSKAIGLLSAVALGLASSAITIATEVRSYQLSSFFTLLAFFWYLKILPQQDRTGKWYEYAGFAVAATGAVASHYYAALFLGGCCLLPVLLMAFSREYRVSFWQNRRSLLWFTGALLVPLGVLLKLYLSHVRGQPIQGYLYDFYWGFKPHETRWGFVGRNLQNLWNLFSPLAIETQSIFLLVLAVCLAGAGYWLVRSIQTGCLQTMRALPVLFAMILVAELIGLSLKDKYPMGGLLRHQYVVAPFLLMAAFLALDGVLQGLHYKLRLGLLAGLGGWIGLRFVLAPSLVLLPGYVITKNDFDAYRAAFPHAQGIFLDHWSIIGYFMNTDSEPRQFVRQVVAPGLVDQYEVGTGPQPRTTIFYNKLDFLLDLQKADTYRSFAACLRQTELKELTLFFFVPGGGQLPEPPAALRHTMEQLAAHEGLKITKAVIGKDTVFAGFAAQ